MRRIIKAFPIRKEIQNIKLPMRYVFIAAFCSMNILSFSSHPAQAGTTDAKVLLQNFGGDNIPEGTNFDKQKTCQVQKHLSADKSNLEVCVGRASADKVDLVCITINATSTKAISSNITLTSPMPIQADFENSDGSSNSKESISVDYNDDAQSAFVAVYLNGKKRSCDLLIQE